MPQTINTNLASLTAQRNLNTSQDANNTALQRLSSGLRINSARDDAAGLAISARFTAQVRGLNVAIRNAGDGISLAQTAEGALSAVADSLQRIRELALQSANATNSDSDRASLNLEVRQLIDEITRVSVQTNFNGRKILDGTFSSSVQIGTQVGETVSFKVNKVAADTLGAGLGAGVSALGSSSPMGNGDLVINGVQISPSSALDDSASTNNPGASAIAKVTAINRHSDASGVRATVNDNFAAGSAMTAAALAGTVTINGVAISIATGAVSNAANRAAVVQAINTKSEQTGIVAVDTGVDTRGVSLIAKDGRNIQVSFATLTAAATGLAAAGTYEGGYTLTSQNGGDVVIAGGDGSGTGNLANAGLAAGTYSANQATVTSIAQSVAANATANALTEGDLVINGVTIGAARDTDDTASDTGAVSSSAGASGIATAAAINRSTPASGVQAVVNRTVVSGGGTGTVLASGIRGSVYVNGIETRDIVSVGDLQKDRANAVAAINEISGRTGVVASDNGTSITLAAEDGRNLSVAVDLNTAGGGAAGFGAGIGLDPAGSGIGAADITAGATYAATAETTNSTVRLVSAGMFTVATGSNGSTAIAGIGFEEGTFGGSESGQFIAEVNISSIKGAEKALTAVDNALEQVNSERASLGAIQNRLDSTISSLAINAENTSAANSRILDADFARETAELSRTQVLQQAGVSILAQANAQPQLVLQLLQQ